MSRKLVLQDMKSYGWRTWGDALREIVIGALVGCAILIFEEGALDRWPDLRGFGRNSILGACIAFVSRGLETALSWALEQSRIPTAFRAGSTAPADSSATFSA